MITLGQSSTKKEMLESGIDLSFDENHSVGREEIVVAEPVSAIPSMSSDPMARGEGIFSRSPSRYL